MSATTAVPGPGRLVRLAEKHRAPVRFVLDVCHPVYVLDFGKVIAKGGPDEIRSDQAVADAYLGTMHDTAAATP